MSLSRRTFAALTGAAATSLALPAGAEAAAGSSPSGAAAPLAAGAPRTAHTVAFDRYSLIIDGRPVPVWSGEMHPFRLPSPSLWRDILQKLAASGYNAVSIPCLGRESRPMGREGRPLGRRREAPEVRCAFAVTVK